MKGAIPTSTLGSQTHALAKGETVDFVQKQFVKSDCVKFVVMSYQLVSVYKVTINAQTSLIYQR